MDDEEFEESDIMFVEVEVSNKHDNVFERHQHNILKRKRKRKKRSSVPISIPKNKSKLFAYDESTCEYDLFEADYESEERTIAPKVMWSRRGRESAAYSLGTECGSTLKIRDFIFKITGIYDT
ncbi:uncharacterized protein [Rutidosis leptorrhynchoides]|uniref:uncharacterized protein n=1 Tax=Rutidosis leptorrhynchoides TaxID=125765 RepID=UPI003A99B287